MKSYSVVDTPSYYRSLFRLALPALAEETLLLLVSWTDWWLAGRYLANDDTKAAMGLMSYLMWLIPCAFAFISIGALALIARFVGARDWIQARRIANQAVGLGLITAVIMTVAMIWLSRPLVEAMQLRDLAAQLAGDYLLIIVWVVPLIMFEQVGAACLRGAGDTVTGFAAKSIVVVVNLIVSIVLVTGWGWFPQLGWTGLALGTAIGHGLGGLIILLVLLRGRAGLKLHPREWAITWKESKRILTIGIPGGLDIMTLLGSQLVFLSLVNSLGVAAAAAHGLAIQIEACAYLPGGAFQIAAATLAGQFLGAGAPQRATRAVLTTMLVGGTLICGAGFVMYWGGERIAEFFSGQTADATTEMAGKLLRIVAWAMPALSIVMVLGGALRGAGDTRLSLLVTVIGLFVVRLPLAVLFCFEGEIVRLGNWGLEGFGWGVAGAWLAMFADLHMRAGLLLFRFVQGGWRKSIH
ncbi:MAG TPA: MATE family efflux transporter [Pirellulaceae bacterium]|nr:MATE family efflux transporter [Pirellulaceae bacterium]